MSVQIIDQSSQKARLKYAGSLALAEGVQQAAFQFAQGVQAYGQQLEAQRQRELTASTVLAQKYGFNKLGADFMLKYENLVGGGFKFPRNGTGTPELPLTDEEAMKAKMAPIVDKYINSPEGREGVIAAAGFTSQPKPQSEQELERFKANNQAWYNSARIAVDKMNADARMYAAMNKGSGVGRAQMRDQQPSGMMIDPTDPTGWRAIPWVEGKGRNLPQVEYRNRLENKKMEQGDKRLHVQRLIQDLKVDTIDNRNLIDWMKIAANRKNSPEQRHQANVLIQTHRRVKDNQDMDMPEGMLESIWNEVLDAVRKDPPTTVPAATLGSKTPTNAAVAPAVSKDMVKQSIQQYRDVGVHPVDIFNQMGRDPKVLEAMDEMGIDLNAEQ